MTQPQLKHIRAYNTVHLVRIIHTPHVDGWLLFANIICKIITETHDSVINNYLVPSRLGRRVSPVGLFTFSHGRVVSAAT